VIAWMTKAARLLWRMRDAVTYWQDADTLS